MNDMSCEESSTLTSILAVLHERTGADFTRYRAATVYRRVLNRMISIGERSLDGYLHVLEASREEAEELLDRIAIKVSRFYRHRPSYDVLRAQVFPRFAERARARPMRIWSAGCGCGEEPYTLAMLLDEAGLAGEVEATDIDPAALARARAARYPLEAAAELPQELAARYLVKLSDGQRDFLTVTNAVRARVRFSRLDLTSGVRPGAGTFDLVCCRNVLIYLQRDLREEVFDILYAATAPGAYVFLGEAEWPSDRFAGSLVNVERGTRVFHALDGYST